MSSLSLHNNPFHVIYLFDMVREGRTGFIVLRGLEAMASKEPTLDNGHNSFFIHSSG